jgi:hypothetical protein
MTEPTVIPVEYRTWHIGQPPRRTKLDIGGWAGDNTWKKPQAWHCKPFSDATTYGLELIYPWETTCEVTCDENGKCHFFGDFTKEKPKGSGDAWEPFGAFAPWHFGFVSMIDIKTQLGYGLMVQPHPRIYADKNGSTPIAIPGLLEMDWWPEVFFIVFKAPLPGCKLIFKKGDPVATFTIVPKNIKYDIKEMSEEEQNTRAKRQGNLEQKWEKMCTRVFHCEDGKEFFDNKYKVLSNIAKREGLDVVNSYLDDPTKLPHWDKKPQVVDHRPKADYVEPILPADFWKDVPPIEEDKDVIEAGLGDLEELLSKTDDFMKLSDEEVHGIINSFKMRKRKVRMEQSMKVKGQCQPTKLTPNKPMVPRNKKNQEGEWVMGHKVEKLL